MKEKTGLTLGVVAVTLAILAFLVSSAPFTPAIALLYVIGPLILISAILGAWRLSFLGAYFSVAAWVSSPLSGWNTPRVDHFLVISAIFGVFLGLILYTHWKHRAKFT